LNDKRKTQQPKKQPGAARRKSDFDSPVLRRPHFLTTPSHTIAFQFEMPAAQPEAWQL